MKGLDAAELPQNLDLFEDAEPDKPEALLPIGALVGAKYAIKRVLGSGGNGAVYEGEHTAIGHRVAIKVVRLAGKERALALSRFSREARICGSLRHPNVGQVYDVGMLEDGSPYMVMELQEGRSLGDIFDEMQLPIVALVDIARQLLAGLSAAHSFGVIHRDIKPDNVMIVRDVKGAVVVKLVDFGISKTVRTDVDGGTTDEDVIIGSPDYMAPEQFRGAPIDVRTDLYAVGVLLYEGITGRLPFRGDTIADLLVSVLQDKVEPPTALRADCPPELERIVLNAMSRDPALRPESADVMSRALDRLGGPRQEVGESLSGLDEQPGGARLAAAHRRLTADLRTLQDLGAQVERRSRASRGRRTALLVGSSMAALGLIATLSHLRSTQASTANPQPPARLLAAAPAPSAPPAAQAQLAPQAVAAATGQRTTVQATTEADVPILAAEQAASESVRSRERSTRSTATSSRAIRRVAPGVATKASTPPVAPAAAPAPPPTQTSTADATATSALLREAGIAFVRGEPERSRDLYSQVLARDPARADAYRGLGLASARLGRRAEAARAFERYLQLRPNAADAARIRTELAKLR
jgi:serine/threonine protein kinase